MKTLLYFGVAVTTLLSSFQTVGQTSVRSEIEKVNDEFEKAVSNKDADAVSQLYTSDARLMFAHMQEISGREAIKSFFQHGIDHGITAVKLTTEEVKGASDFAVESGRYATMVGDQIVDEGNYLVEWRKVNGEWRLHKDMPCSDRPVAQASAKVDQPVGIAVFKVKNENAEAFQAFVKDVLLPSCDTSTPEKSQAIKSIRMLKENGSAEDGTQKFVFIFDPYYPEVEYEIEDILIAKHGEEKGKKLNQEFSDLTVPFYEYYDMRQLALH